MFACSLQYLQNAYVALDHLAAGLGYDLRAVDARYGWARLRTGYRAALAQVVARWLAVPGDAAWTAATRLAQLVPLVPAKPCAPFSPRDFAEGVRDRGGAGAARALGGRLARHTAMSPAQLDAMLASLSGERLHAERAELVAEAAADRQAAQGRARRGVPHLVSKGRERRIRGAARSRSPEGSPMKKQQPKQPKSPILLQLPTADLAKISGGQAPKEECKK